MPFGFGLGLNCCGGGGNGTFLYVIPRFCGTYSGDGVEVRLQGPGVDETRTLGSSPMSEMVTYTSPPAGPWTITVTGPCLRSSSATVTVVAGAAAFLFVDVEPGFPNTYSWSDDYGSCTISKIGISCTWNGSYEYGPSDGIGWDGEQRCHDRSVTVPVRVWLILNGVSSGTATFQAQRMVPVWQSGTCAGAAPLETRPSTESCRGPLSDTAYVNGLLAGTCACGASLLITGTIGSLVNSPWSGYATPPGCRVVSTSYTRQGSVFTPTVTIS
jgi:hypothetical protein